MHSAQVLPSLGVDGGVLVLVFGFDVVKVRLIRAPGGGMLVNQFEVEGARGPHPLMGWWQARFLGMSRILGYLCLLGAFSPRLGDWLLGLLSGIEDLLVEPV